jgi:hypothetical protein
MKDTQNRQRLCVLVCVSWLLLAACSGSRKRSQLMQEQQWVNAVTNQKIQFVTTGEVGAPLPTLGRRVVVTGPPEALLLISSGDVRVLHDLVSLLADPNRAWAAEVLLASLTRHDEDIVNAFASRPDQWQASLGSGAQSRWNEWLRPREGKLRWDPESRAFAETKRSDIK